MALYITTGKADFQFTKHGVTQVYSKSSIEEINVLGAGTRSSRLFGMMAVVFKDGTSIIVPCILIEGYTFVSKFPGCKESYIN